MTSNRKGVDVPAPERSFHGYWTPGRKLLITGILAGILGLLSPYLAHKWIIFDVASHFTVQYIVVIIACTIGILRSRYKVMTAALIALLGMVAIGGMARFHSIDTVSTENVQKPNLQAFKVMTFNTWAVNHNWQQVMAEIKRHDPDVVGMVEFTDAKIPMLAQLKQQFPHQQNCIELRYCHMALLSKLPIEQWQARTLWKGPPYLKARLKTDAGEVTLYLVHTLRPPHYRAQMKQITAMAQLVAKDKGKRIVMGDFNATPFSRNISNFADITRFQRITDVPSWPSEYTLGLPQIAIDHIFISPDIAMVKPGRIGENAGSDHFPVQAVINLTP